MFWFIQQGGLSAQAFVCIEVEDINDNHPVFDPVTYMASISIHTPPGTEIINVFATDKDSGIYGTLTYELIPGDLSSLFTVDTSTGRCLPQRIDNCTSLLQDTEIKQIKGRHL